MKRIYILIMLMCPMWAMAQTSGGPDNYGYTWKDSNHPTGPTYSWIDITQTGTLVTGLADDNTAGPFTMYGFQYYTSNPTQFWIGSNGFISFSNIISNSTNNSTFQAIPTSTGTAYNYLAIYNTDFTFAAYQGQTSPNSTCYRYEDASMLVVSFINVPFWTNNTLGYTGSNSFQVILDKADNSIKYQYQTQTGTANSSYTSNFIVIGIENATGSSGLQHSRGSTYPAVNKAIKFYYPSSAGNVTDIGMAWNMNSSNGSVFMPSGGSSVLLTANVKNYGNQPVSNFDVNYAVYDQFGLSMGTGTYIVNYLGAGQDQNITFSSPLVTAAPGEYYFRTIVSGVTGDNVTSNDTSIYQFNVVNTSTSSVYLDYSDQAANGSGLGWSGGNGGIAIYIEPPFYPARIENSKFNISGNATTPVGFHAVIFDDDGMNGGAGTVLDSVFVPGTSVMTNSYNTVPTANSNLVIYSGGVYLLWFMGGESINLARDTDLPSSRRTYEVLQGAWAGYRDLNTQDFLMGITVTSNITSIEPQKEMTAVLYPNPAKDVATLRFNETVNTNTMDVKVFDMSGKEVQMKYLRYADKVDFFCDPVTPGEYIYRISWADSNKQVSGKMLVE